MAKRYLVKPDEDPPVAEEDKVTLLLEVVLKKPQNEADRVSDEDVANTVAEDLLESHWVDLGHEAKEPHLVDSVALVTADD